MDLTKLLVRTSAFFLAAFTSMCPKDEKPKRAEECHNTLVTYFLDDSTQLKRYDNVAILTASSGHISFRTATGDTLSTPGYHFYQNSCN